MRGHYLTGGKTEAGKTTILYLVTEDWYFCSHRLPVARAARDHGFDVAVATRVNAHGEELRAEGFKVIPIGMRRGGTRPVGELGSLAELVRLYRRERPDLVHHVSMKPVLYGSVAAHFSSVPAVINALTGLGYVFSSKTATARILRPFTKVVLGRLLSSPCSRIIVQNPDDGRLLQRAGVPQERVTIIGGSGVDIQRFVPTPEPEGPVNVAFVSRMLWDKGVGELVEAARILGETHPEIWVNLVGPPDPENPASIPNETLESWSRENAIRWNGPTRDVPGVWARSHIAVFPTSYGEGLPKTLLEAAACGRPIVATDVPGCREVVRDGENGFLVPLKNPGAIADAIIRLADDRALRLQMGECGRRLVEREFSEERVVEMTLKLYEAALEDGGGIRAPA